MEGYSTALFCSCRRELGLWVARRTEIPLEAPALTADEVLLGVSISLIYSRETLRQLTVVIHGDWPLVELGAWYIAQVGDVESGARCVASRNL